MRITVQSEWMKCQKHADLMTTTDNPPTTLPLPIPSSVSHGLIQKIMTDFQVVQTPIGDSVFFSIGTDNVLYATRQARLNSTGWTRQGLSSSQKSTQGGATIKAKAFVVYQNINTLAFDLALAVTVGSTDYLLLLIGNSNTYASWAQGVHGTLIPFDHPSRALGAADITIADLYLTNLATTSQAQTCFVDIWRSAQIVGPILHPP
ncbi:MAG: hypothetical protein Q9223_001225 [Gallowayella weberi]